MSAFRQPLLTPERYLELERAAEFRSEYFEGEVYAMSGRSYRHALVMTEFEGRVVPSEPQQ